MLACIVRGCVFANTEMFAICPKVRVVFDCRRLVKAFDEVPQAPLHELLVSLTDELMELRVGQDIAVVLVYEPVWHTEAMLFAPLSQVSGQVETVDLVEDLAAVTIHIANRCNNVHTYLFSPFHPEKDVLSTSQLVSCFSTDLEQLPNNNINLLQYKEKYNGKKFETRT